MGEKRRAMFMVSDVDNVISELLRVASQYESPTEVLELAASEVASQIADARRNEEQAEAVP